jgi:hypothetical protein
MEATLRGPTPTLIAVAAFVLAFTAVAAAAAGLPAIDKALAVHFKSPSPPSYEYALIDLNGDGLPEAVVLITDSSYCGSGGCTMSVLRGDGHSFAYVSGSTITREPIRVLTESRFGWKTLSVNVAGGGIQPGETVMRFDGKRYPLNPGMQPYASPTDLIGATALVFRQ